METSYNKESEKKFIFILSLLFIILTLFVLKSIFTLIVYSAILAYFLNPLYNYLLEKFKNRRISSLLTLLSATIGFFLPLALFLYFIILNLLKLLVAYKIYIENPVLLQEQVTIFLEQFTQSFALSSVNFSSFFSNIVVYLVEYVQNFFSSIPLIILSFFIVLFITYYVLIHKKRIFSTLEQYLPLEEKKQKELIKNISLNLKVLFKGYFLTALIQTIVAFVGYLIFGVPNVLIIAFLTFITSLIPYLGTPMIWVPVSIYLIISGNQIGGIGLLIYGTVIISMIDNFVRPILMSSKKTLSPALVFLGFIGGLFAFGVSGIILGPLILSITALLLNYVRRLYIQES